MGMDHFKAPEVILACSWAESPAQGWGPQERQDSGVSLPGWC